MPSNWAGVYKSKAASVFCQVSVFSSTAIDLATLETVGFIYKSSRREIFYYKNSSCKFYKIRRKNNCDSVLPILRNF